MSDCEHEGPQYRIRDLDATADGVETISCIDCIADELETLSALTAVRWEIERLLED
jgi:hypothetical protein